LKRIGILSDTHGYIDHRMIEFIQECDEIWHAGDIGTFELIQTFELTKNFRGVYGNIDGREIRMVLPAIQRFECEGVDVMMKHIGGYPGKYDHSILPILQLNPPKLLITGHSHILKIMHDKKYDLLFINPGAAGKEGSHKIRTMVRFTIDQSNIRDLEVVEFEKRM
jgi:putative phosphoesterase